MFRASPPGINVALSSILQEHPATIHIILHHSSSKSFDLLQNQRKYTGRAFPRGDSGQRAKLSKRVRMTRDRHEPSSYVLFAQVSLWPFSPTKVKNVTTYSAETYSAHGHWTPAGRSRYIGQACQALFPRQLPERKAAGAGTDPGKLRVERLPSLT